MRNRPILAALVLAWLSSPAAWADLDLDEFVKKADPSYGWKAVETKAIPGATVHQLLLTSQTWQGAPWTHDLQIVEPDEVKYPDVMLLFITGGANKADNPRFRNAADGLAMAQACGARVAVLPQVPNQPLMGGKTEDDLIAETFTRYLETKDDTLPLLQPMVKSAVRAMDAVQEWAKREGKPVPSKFVVTGASKRGWTTWLTGAVDPRVMAIAPMVIPTLNMKAQNKHQIDSWGKYSEQIADYTRRGLTEKMDEPDGAKLWKLIDPYTYRDRLTMPKLQINGTNDPYWTLDSLNLYWDDLKGPSYVVYLPNAVHNLKEHRDWAVSGVGALFRHVASGRPMPTVSIKSVRADTGGEDLTIETVPASSGTFWTAEASDLDFRKSPWTSSEPRRGQSVHTFRLPDAKDGKNRAVFGDLTFEIDGLEYHLSTPISITRARAPK